MYKKNSGDTLLLAVIEEDLPRLIDKINECFKDFCLGLNVKKTKVIIIEKNIHGRQRWK